MRSYSQRFQDVLPRIYRLAEEFPEFHHDLREYLAMSAMLQRLLEKDAQALAKQRARKHPGNIGM